MKHQKKKTLKMTENSHFDSRKRIIDEISTVARSALRDEDFEKKRKLWRVEAEDKDRIEKTEAAITKICNAQSDALKYWLADNTQTAFKLGNSFVEEMRDCLNSEPANDPSKTKRNAVDCLQYCLVCDKVFCDKRGKRVLVPRHSRRYTCKEAELWSWKGSTWVWNTESERIMQWRNSRKPDGCIHWECEDCLRKTKDNDVDDDVTKR